MNQCKERKSEQKFGKILKIFFTAPRLFMSGILNYKKKIFIENVVSFLKTGGLLF